MKKLKSLKTAHTSNSKMGMGDNYGTGVKNPPGKVRDSFVTNKISPKKLGKPPKSLA